MKTRLIFSIIILTFFFSGCASQTPTPSLPKESPAATETSGRPEASPAIAEKPAIKEGVYCEELLVIGEAEYVTIEPDGMKLAARIDTGATTSSLGATEIKNYERDGKKWVRFKVTDPVSGKILEINRPLTRIVPIKRHGVPDQKRPVVTLPIRMGPIDVKTEFSLTDRTKFEYPVLIGRSFLEDKAIVDVSRKYATSPLGKE